MRANALFGYPIPAAAAEILMNMPPPHCFQVQSPQYRCSVNHLLLILPFR